MTNTRRVRKNKQKKRTLKNAVEKTTQSIKIHKGGFNDDNTENIGITEMLISTTKTALIGKVVNTMLSSAINIYNNNKKKAHKQLKKFTIKHFGQIINDNELCEKTLSEFKQHVKNIITDEQARTYLHLIKDDISFELDETQSVVNTIKNKIMPEYLYKILQKKKHCRKGKWFWQ